MAFNITGGITITNSVPRTLPNIPTNLTATRVSKTTGRLMWDHVASFFSPHVGFKIQYKLNSEADTEWETLGAVGPTPGPNGFNLDINDIASHTVSYDFRVLALPDPSVRILGEDDSAQYSAVATLVPDPINTPVLSELAAGPTNDTCLITWTFVSNFQCVTQFILECAEGVLNAGETEPPADDADSWRVIGTVADTSEMAGVTTTYQFIQNGYALQDDFIFYRVRALTVNGEEGDNSNIEEFSPLAPDDIADLAFERTGVDVGRFTWSYSGVPVRAFLIEAAEVDLLAADPDAAWSPVSTVDSSAPLNADDKFSWVFTGLSTEAESIRYRIRTVGVNAVLGEDPSNVVTVNPVAPLPPNEFEGTVNEGVGTVTSVSFAWNTPEQPFTNISEFVLQFRPVTTPVSPWIQVNTYTSAERSAEVLPPQQGAIQFRMGITGTNGLESQYYVLDNEGNLVLDDSNLPTLDTTLNTSLMGFTGVLSLVTSGGSATDDAIYNGDNQFISTQHFSINDDDKCLDRDSLTDFSSSGSITEIGGIEYLIGTTGQQLDLEWSFQVSQQEVDNNRHFYLNLNALELGAFPTRLWEVDTGNVIVEVATDPINTPPFYLSGDPNDTTYIFIDDNTNTNTAANTRGFQERLGVPSFMYAAREQIRLNMRRTFTFRADGFVNLRISFLADTAGFPMIPLPPAGSATSDNSLCLEAFASATEETGEVVIPTAAGSFALDFTNTYESIPMVTATATGSATPCVVYVSSKSLTGAVIEARDLNGNNVDCTVDYTVRGY